MISLLAIRPGRFSPSLKVRLEQADSPSQLEDRSSERQERAK